MPTKHSTPAGEAAAMRWSPRPGARASYLQESPRPAHSAHLLGFSPGATFRRRRLSTIYAMEEGPSMQSGPSSDPSALGDDAPVPGLPARPQQEVEDLRARSWPRSVGLPGVPDTAKRKRRDPKRQAAVVLQVRQWEARLLQDIEAAVHHELTIQAEGPPGMDMVLVGAEEPVSSD